MNDIIQFVGIVNVVSEQSFEVQNYFTNEGFLLITLWEDREFQWRGEHGLTIVNFQGGYSNCRVPKSHCEETLSLELSLHLLMYPNI